MATKFLGASIIDYKSQLGWNESESECTIRLVEDIHLGDRFVLNDASDPEVGRPHTLSFAGQTFRGLIKSWVELDATDGKPTYQVRLVDPRNILAGAQVIVSNYYGISSLVPNTINAFGYWENIFGFGASLNNEGGMPWFKIGAALNAIVNGGVATLYGGPLAFRGQLYKIDLSALPITPFFYRLTGPSLSVLDCITQVCEDSGSDFFFTLTTDNVITLHTVSRRTQIAFNNGPNSGAINKFIASVVKGYNSKSRGWELRNDGPTSKLLVGANVSTLYRMDQPSIFPYWGTDINGNHITSLGLDDTDVVNLNSLQCFDIVGPVYTCTIGELRVALLGEQYWENYIQNNRPDLWAILSVGLSNLSSTIMKAGLGAPAQQMPPGDFFMADDEATRRFKGDIYRDLPGLETKYKYHVRVFQMVQSAASQHLGKSFLIKMPFVLYTFDSETQEFIFSHSVDSSGFIPDGSQPLGLLPINQLLFEDQNGKTVPFAFYTNNIVDTNFHINTDTVIQDSGIYTKVNTQSQFVRTPNGQPALIVTINHPVFEPQNDPPYGVLDTAIAFAVGTNKLTAQDKANFRGPLDTVTPYTHEFGVVPKPLIPNNIAVALQSNILTYGPWSIVGAIGWSAFEKDDSLNPWNFGGYANMNLAANDKLFEGATNLLVGETGDIKFAGTPLHSLGDELIAGGSNITGINVGIDKGGITTTYSLRTFDLKFIGRIARREEERLKRIGRGLNNQKNRLREALMEQFLNYTIAYNTINFGKPDGIRPLTPHAVLFGKGYDFDGPNQKHHDAVTTGTVPEIMVNLHPDKSQEFLNIGVVSINGVMRPFSTHNVQPNSPDDRPDIRLPKFGASIYEDANQKNLTGIYSSYTLNPFGVDNDFLYYVQGDDAKKNIKKLNYNFQTKEFDNSLQGTRDTVRALSLRGPLIVTGYGFDLNCQSVVSGYPWLSREDRASIVSWKSGPVDFIWDQYRGTWTCHDIIVGELTSDLDAFSPPAGKGSQTSVSDVSNFIDDDDNMPADSFKTRLQNAKDNYDAHKNDPIPSNHWPVANMKILGDNSIDTLQTMKVYNIFPTSISKGTQVIVGYNAIANKFVVVSASC